MVDGFSRVMVRMFVNYKLLNEKIEFLFGSTHWQVQLAFVLKRRNCYIKYVTGRIV